MDDSPELTIGEVARRAGVATSSIRYYESIGCSPRRIGWAVSGATTRTCSASWAFIGVAQSAGFKLRGDQGADRGVDEADGWVDRCARSRARSSTEVEALLERTKAMKGWLEVAQECGCATPEECALFPEPGEEPIDPDLALRVVQIDGGNCRRATGPA